MIVIRPFRGWVDRCSFQWLEKPEFTPPVCTAGERQECVRFQTGVIIVAPAPDIGETFAEERAVGIPGALFFDNAEPSGFFGSGLRFSEQVLNKQQDREQIVLAITVTGAGVAADPQEPPIRKNEVPDHIPKIPDMMIELRRRSLSAFFEIEMQHGEI